MIGNGSETGRNEGFVAYEITACAIAVLSVRGIGERWLEMC
jgi:hypothetical protein